MAPKVFFLFVGVLVLFEAQAAFYRREFFDPESSLMRDLMNDDHPISPREMPNNEGRCKDAWTTCSLWKEMGYCSNRGYYTSNQNFVTFTKVWCKQTCGGCFK